MTTENNLAIVDWEPPMPPTDLIFDDGEPLESNRHRIAMNVLIRSLQQAWADRNDYFFAVCFWYVTRWSKLSVSTTLKNSKFSFQAGVQQSKAFSRLLQ